jgi:ribokinase
MPNTARLLVLGSSNTDLTVRLPHLPAAGQTVLGGSLDEGPGGKGANQAVAAARAGAQVVFITTVGDDAFGRHALDAYRREGIDVAHARTVKRVASGVALIFVSELGDNMIGVAPGANAHLAPDHINGLPDEIFTADRLLLVAGLEIPLETVAQAVRRARRTGMIVVLNPAPVHTGLIEAGILDAIDVITPNRIELGQITGLPTEGSANLMSASQALLERGPRGIVVTLGSEGCLVLDQRTKELIPSHPVVAVDTVGAGDAFSGALAVALAEGHSLQEAAAWAGSAAALTVTQPGAQGALPRRVEIDRMAGRDRV